MRRQGLAAPPQAHALLEAGLAALELGDDADELVADGRVVMDQAEVEVEELLRVRVARGDFAVRVAGLP